MKLDYPATGRNRDPILEVLRRVLPARGVVLEIAAGSGQHTAYFAPRLGPELTWQPTDLDPEVLASIAGWSEELPNVQAPLSLDTTAETWPVTAADVIYCANMVHIAPWEAALGLLRGAGRVLSPGGLLLLYGPYKRAGQHTADSNARFDSSLRARDPSWGVRDLEEVVAVGSEHGLVLEEVVEMPANNLSVILRR